MILNYEYSDTSLIGVYVYANKNGSLNNEEKTLRLGLLVIYVLKHIAVTTLAWKCNSRYHEAGLFELSYADVLHCLPSSAV